MYLAFICNIKSLPHLALCIFYLIKIEAVNSHVFPDVQFQFREQHQRNDVVPPSRPEPEWRHEPRSGEYYIRNDGLQL